MKPQICVCSFTLRNALLFVLGPDTIPSALMYFVKLLGVQLSAYKKFRIDMGYMKSKFSCAFNSLFHNAAKLKDELTTMHCFIIL